MIDLTPPGGSAFVDIMSNLLGVIIILVLVVMMVATPTFIIRDFQSDLSQTDINYLRRIPGAYNTHMEFYVAVQNYVFRIDLDAVARKVPGRNFGELISTDQGKFFIKDRFKKYQNYKKEVMEALGLFKRDISAFSLHYAFNMENIGSICPGVECFDIKGDDVRGEYDRFKRALDARNGNPTFFVYDSAFPFFTKFYEHIIQGGIFHYWHPLRSGEPIQIQRKASDFSYH